MITREPIQHFNTEQKMSPMNKSEQQSYLFVLFKIKDKQELPSNSEDGKSTSFTGARLIRSKEILHLSPIEVQKKMSISS